MGIRPPASSGTTGMGSSSKFVARSPLELSGGGPTAAATGANTAYLLRFELEHAQVINRLMFWVGTQSGNVDVGIYDDDGTNGAPGTRLVSSGSTACPAGGAAAITVADTTLQPGGYYAAIVFDNGTAQIARWSNMTYTGIGAVVAPGYSKGSAFPLPSLLSSPSALGNDIFGILAGNPGN